ncbi:MAG: ATP-dependent zinc metalloprotease FtsH [Defluviitaleaceae bacterium]|nr:ATP-dependent zinc metalloprotease FtsH [Defluviitaleaceae bacterium]
MNNTPRRSFGIYFVVIMFIALVIIAFNANLGGTDEPEFTFSDLHRAVAENQITRMEVVRHSEIGGAATVTITMRAGDGDLGSGTTHTVEIVAIENFLNWVNPYHMSNGFTMTMDNPRSNPFLSMLWPFLIILVPILLLFFFLNQMQGGGGGGGNRVMSFGKSRAKAVVDDKRKVTFENVAGLEEEKADLQEIVEFLKQPKKFQEIGARIPKGVLLVGPPGTGKTLLARAVAGEAAVPFFSISGSDFVEMFVGVGASRVRDLFEQAKKSAPCIVFIDEIDAVGRRRGAGLGGGHDEREQTLNQLLVEMDGFGANEGIIILAATNRPDILDPALLRPGRFDRRVVVGRPDVKGRKEILQVHAIGKKLASDVDLEAVAKLTSGFTGADLENLLNEAALLAARDDKKQLDMSDVRRAFIKVAVGTEKKSRVVSKKDKKATAYHEAGHGIAMEALSELDPVHQLSIIPTGMAGGYAMALPKEELYRTKRKMEQEIIMIMAGRAAEFMITNDISSGASSDIQRATSIARDMVMKYGMSEELGPILFGSESEEVFLGRDIGQNRNYGEDVAATIDKEIKRLVDGGYKKATELIHQHMDTMHKTAELLIEKEKITGAEFRALFDPPLPPKNRDDDEPPADTALMDLLNEL